MDKRTIENSALLLSPPKFAGRTLPLGQLTTRAKILAVQNDDESWGLAVENAGAASMMQARPLKVEIFNPADERVREYVSGYAWVRLEGGALNAGAEIRLPQGACIRARDHWAVADDALKLSRTVEVAGQAPCGFLSTITLESERGVSLSSLKPFVPGMIYGNSEYITPTAIGGSAHYEAGVRQVRIREDRLPIPMAGLYFPDGTSVTVYNARPDAGSNVRDAEEKIAGNQVNEGCRVAALGYCEGDDEVTLGMWFPGTEGEVTYQWALSPDNQVRRWRGRYHPVREGFTQRYEVEFRFSQDETFDRFYTRAWRAAWDRLRPGVRPQDIELVRQTVVSMVADRVVSSKGLSGIPTICQL